MPTDAFYDLALRPRITLMTVDGVDTLYTYDAFSGSNPINVTYVDMENSIGENGTFNIHIADHNNVIPKDDIHHVKVKLELGKSSGSYQHFMQGFGETFIIDRPQTNEQNYLISGLSTREWAYQLYIHRREKYRKDESDAKIYNIIDNALTKRLWRPLKTHDLSIEDITGWDPSGISTKVNTVYTVVNKPFTFFGDLCDELCDITGAVWLIDYSLGSEIFTLTYNPDLQTNIVIKSGDLMNRLNDNADKTSYIVGGFAIEDTTGNEAGTATRLITVTVKDKEEVFTIADEAKGGTNTTFKALAQQIILNNDARRIDSITLELKKKGEPTSPNDRINGDICLDNNNKPTGTVLDEFNIPISSIKDSATDVEIEVDISPKKLDVAQSKIWIRLFQRSNEEDINGDPDGDGNPNHGEKHTIIWNHNNKFNTTQDYYSASAVGGDADNKDKLSWTSTNQGPLYECTINSNIRRLFARTNKQAAKLIRLREQFIPTDFLSDPTEVMRYLSLNLSKTSKARRGIGEFKVKVPNNFLFRPYQWISFNDGLSDISDLLHVQRAKYIVASTSSDAQVGALYAHITLSGSYNTLVGACSCV